MTENRTGETGTAQFPQDWKRWDSGVEGTMRILRSSVHALRLPPLNLPLASPKGLNIDG